MYSLCESGLDHLESEQLLPTAGIHGAINPMLAGAVTGLVYKSTGTGHAHTTACAVRMLGQ